MRHGTLGPGIRRWAFLRGCQLLSPQPRQQLGALHSEGRTRAGDGEKAHPAL